MDKKTDIPNGIPTAQIHSSDSEQAMSESAEITGMQGEMQNVSQSRLTTTSNSPSSLSMQYAEQPSEQPARPKPSYSNGERILAWLMFPAAFIFVRWFLYSELGFGAAAFLLVFCALSALIAKTRGGRLNSASFILLITAAAFSSALTFISDPFLCLLDVIYVIIVLLYWYLYAFSDIEFLSAHLFNDLVKAVFVMPFGSFGCIYGAAGSTFKNKKSGKVILGIIGGCALAFIPSAIVLNLLISADSAFSGLLEYIFSGLFIGFDGAVIFQVLLALPIAMFVFGMIYSSVKHRYSDKLTPEKAEKAAKSSGFIPASVFCAASVPLCLIYLLFFVSQLSYFTGAFANILPEGFSYSSYAREGFFQLCAVSVINALIILCGSVFSRKRESSAPVSVRSFITVLCVFTLGLIATALSKMIMYIGIYGLTKLRVYTSWFMLLLALLFITLIVKQWVKKVNYQRCAAIIFTLMFAALIFPDTNAVIAEVNVARYENGSAEEVDINAMYDLSWSAVPAVAELLDAPDVSVRGDADRFCRSMANIIAHMKDKNENASESPWFISYNFSLIRAENALKKAGYDIEKNVNDGPYEVSSEERNYAVLAITLQSGEEISALMFDYGIYGNIIGSIESVSKDGARLTPYKTVYFNLPEEEFSDCGEAVSLFFTLSVINERGIFPLPYPVCFTAEKGGEYSFSLAGDSLDGYTIIPDGSIKDFNTDGVF